MRKMFYQSVTRNFRTWKFFPSSMCHWLIKHISHISSKLKIHHHLFLRNISPICLQFTVCPGSFAHVRIMHLFFSCTPPNLVPRVSLLPASVWREEERPWERGCPAPYFGRPFRDFVGVQETEPWTARESTLQPIQWLNRQLSASFSHIGRCICCF